MLREARIAAVVPVSDRQRAIEFYEKKLGLRLKEETAHEIHFACGGDTMLSLYESVGAGESRHTLAGFVVEDLEGTVASLRDQGVVFDEYDTPQLKTEGGIAQIGKTRGAWFRDPDGNIIAVVEDRP